MRHKERLTTKLSQMTFLMIDCIVKPNEDYHDGEKEMSINWYDDEGNKFTLDAKLTIESPLKAMESPSLADFIDGDIDES